MTGQFCTACCSRALGWGRILGSGKVRLTQLGWMMDQPCQGQFGGMYNGCVFWVPGPVKTKRGKAGQRETKTEHRSPTSWLETVPRGKGGG